MTESEINAKLAELRAEIKALEAKLESKPPEVHVRYYQPAPAYHGPRISYGGVS